MQVIGTLAGITIGFKLFGCPCAPKPSPQCPVDSTGYEWLKKIPGGR
jgi:hypothetical protein